MEILFVLSIVAFCAITYAVYKHTKSVKKTLLAVLGIVLFILSPLFTIVIFVLVLIFSKNTRNRLKNWLKEWINKEDEPAEAENE
ncbi:MAG: hypothetical protein ACM3UU_03640 [Ignavibacteriales bacterium]